MSRLVKTTTPVSLGYLDLSQHARQRPVEEELMFFQASALFAASQIAAFPGRMKLTAVFLDFLATQHSLSEWRIDSRVHMLMPGWYPCIPGWHVDDADRTTRGDGQPDHLNPSYRTEHIMCILDQGTGSYTEFVDEPLMMHEPPEREPGEPSTYALWDEAVKSQRRDVRQAGSRQIISFDDRTLHRGAPAVATGWRWFIRATRRTDGPQQTYANKIRHQANVYLPAPMAGW